MNGTKLFFKILLLIPLLFAGLLPAQVFAVDISVSVDRNPVSMDESFKIYFLASDTPDGEPDFSPLEQDFTVVNQSQSSSSSWVNGQYSKSVRWTVEAIAKKSGNLEIPAVMFGRDTSKPLPIEVSKSGATDDSAKSNEDLYLQVKVTPEQPYVQSQVIYTVRVYRRVEITQASLGEPELTDAVVEKLSQDSEFNTVVNGVSYLVTERKYAIFPQKSGVMAIKPLTLTADVVVDNGGGGRGGFGGFFGSPITQTKRVLSNEVTLNVKPVPASFKGKPWLAAEKLDLTQEWSGDTQQMKIGEPLTRTLTLKGQGTAVGQLPELNTVKTDANVKVYPDQPVLNEQKLPEGITSSRQEKTAIIPAKAGKHSLQAIEIPWFNTKTQTMEIAKIPETIITVPGAVENQPNATLLTPSKTEIAPVTTEANSPIISPSGIKPDNNSYNKWIWVSFFLGMGWAVTLAYFLLKKPKLKPDDSKEQELFRQEIRLNETIKQLKDACAKNDIQAAKNALLTWGKQQFNANNLGTIAIKCDARLRDEMMDLNEALYSKNANAWNGKKLFQAFSENKARAKINQKEESALEPLHRL